jgi:high frequency lysogenization protein
MLKLERVLSRHREMVATIGEGIEGARDKLDHFPMLHPNLLAHLADVYSRTVSQLKPRIMVQGDPRFLQIAGNQNRIRSLLLAGIRAAWLWRQVGGSRWKILLGRKQLLAAAQDYLRMSHH